MNKVLFTILVVFTLFGFMQINNIQQEKWVAPASAKKITNPVSVKKRSSSAKKGAKLFSQYCVVCHGKIGKGDGVGGKALNPKPANLTSVTVQD